MNPRRLMCSPQSEHRTLPHRCRKCCVVHHGKFSRQCLSWVKSTHYRAAALLSAFAPISRPQQHGLNATLCANNRYSRLLRQRAEQRPIFHKLDETIRGHVFCSFLALVLKKALEDRIAALARTGSWPEIIADLDSLTETEIEHDGKRFVLRSAPRPAASLALRAAGVALPASVSQVDAD